jgi:hypothetical protein
VRGAFLVRGLASLAGDLALLGSIHRCKSTIFFCHLVLLALPCSRTLGLQPMCHEILVTLSSTRT